MAAPSRRLEIWRIVKKRKKRKTTAALARRAGKCIAQCARAAAIAGLARGMKMRRRPTQWRSTRGEWYKRAEVAVDPSSAQRQPWRNHLLR